jgi:hypothetical protein
MANERLQIPDEVDRRTLLRRGLLTGLGAVVVGFATPALTRSAQTARIPRSRTRSALATLASAQAAEVQYEWTWCSKCHGLFYYPQQSSSWCPAGGQHDGSTSYGYFL